MKRNKKNINGYILAGGKSSRMGTDKGLLFLNDKPIIQTIIEQLQTVVHKTCIVSNNADYKKFGLEVIPDLMKDKGPAGGIHSALSHTASEQIFVASCDMPFVTSGAMQYLMERASSAQITLPVFHSKMQPLFGVYSKDCLTLWQQLIEKGMIKLQEMVTHFELKKIFVEKNELFVDPLFTNLNDENDFKQALKKLQMEINLLSFGQIADITGGNTLKIPDVKNTNELNRFLINAWPQLRSIKYSIAVNKKIIHENTQLHHEDTVAILPPFSGG